MDFRRVINNKKSVLTRRAAAAAPLSDHSGHDVHKEPKLELIRQKKVTGPDSSPPVYFVDTFQLMFLYEGATKTTLRFTSEQRNART